MLRLTVVPVRDGNDLPSDYRLAGSKTSTSAAARYRAATFVTAPGSCVTASFHLSHHLVVCVRWFLTRRPVFRPLLVSRSVAPVQEVGPYAPVVESEALAMGGVCRAVSRR